MAEYLLPDVGEGLTEAEIVSWKVKVGDVVEINDIVVEIETAKSLVELPSPYAGTVTALLVREGETVAGRHPDHRHRRPERSRRRRRRPPQRLPSAEMEIDLSNPARQRRRRGREPGRPQQGRPRARSGAPRKAATPASRRSRGDPDAGAGRPSQPGRVAPMVEAAEPEPAVPAVSARTSAARRRPTCACWPSRRCASSPRTSASTSPPLDAAPARRHRHPRGRRGGRRQSRQARRSPEHAAASGRARDPRADQGRPQDDGRRDGAVGLHRPARHRVGHRRRHPHDGVRRAAQEAPRVPRRQGLPAAGAGAGLRSWRCGVRRRSTRSGTRPPRRSCSSTTSTSASPRPRRAASSCRTSRTPRTSRCSTWPRRSTSSPPPRARAGPSRPR